jgi:hypothetical protein
MSRNKISIDRWYIIKIGELRIMKNINLSFIELLYDDIYYVAC